ncbi:asparaginyl-tRNA synthetase [Spiroplasma mirum ATCC 29335]|uniref:Asparagine--tRNA ligase n=1 Tax=Spiroplasma mirum ATCC 29335 TaxID=838561 RepID=W0GQF0_9MOLU|nr:MULTISPECIES: asparagine--tRNA ligase [Spiroplasma]AHF60766.1 asparaginyl-tRNA synthetase [Spiroplasma mirum ATCC 29335]AHI57726.1 asparaginyl-tRNA synthetase [Spiroplasma mirum ATCC 29335]AKM52885.1 asparaginyl-tRNA synthetase [Spiroplasma atrichopogonis]
MEIVFDLYQYKIKDQTKIEVLGWVRSNRNNGKLGFLVINDGTCFDDLQVVYKKEAISNFEEIARVRLSSAIKISGIFTLTPTAKQPFELQATAIEVLDLADENYPLQKKEHSHEYLREIAHLRAKTKTFNAVFRIRSSAAFAIHEYFNRQNFVYVNTPIITGNDAEGAGESFIVTVRDDDKYHEDFFDKKASLTVSGQLHAEGFAQAFRSVYTFGPTFRAENSNTTRHAAEFWMIEPEVAFSDLNDIMKLAQGMIKHVIKYLFDHNHSELSFLTANVDAELLTRLQNVYESEFAQTSYTAAIDLLLAAVKNGHQFVNNDIFWGMDLQTEHERYLCEVVNKKPTFLIDYPKYIKAFYMKINDDNKTVAACDLLVPGIGELVGGSQRENDYQKIVNRCLEMKIPTSDLQWYLDLRKYGYYKSSGFGLGFERLLMYVTGMTNIRDVIAFPRTPKNLLF